jgi:hypothetical protein
MAIPCRPSEVAEPTQQPDGSARSPEDLLLAQTREVMKEWRW